MKTPTSFSHSWWVCEGTGQVNSRLMIGLWLVIWLTPWVEEGVWNVRATCGGANCASRHPLQLVRCSSTQAELGGGRIFL